jgi:hypothetical protein
LRVVAEAISEKGGADATQLRIAEAYIQEFGKIAQRSSTIVLPANLTDIGSMLTLAKGLLSKKEDKELTSSSQGLRL